MPPASLASSVKVVWTYACPAPSDTLQRIAPDGCPELILDIGAPYEEQGLDGVFRLQPPALFAGQMTRPIAIRPTRPVELVAVRFHPDGARDWLGGPLSAENPDNDFPQRVLYERTGDVLTARIEGRLGDRERAMDWRFEKAALNTRCPRT